MSAETEKKKGFVVVLLPRRPEYYGDPHRKGEYVASIDETGAPYGLTAWRDKAKVFATMDAATETAEKFHSQAQDDRGGFCRDFHSAEVSALAAAEYYASNEAQAKGLYSYPASKKD